MLEGESAAWAAAAAARECVEAGVVQCIMMIRANSRHAAAMDSGL